MRNPQSYITFTLVRNVAEERKGETKISKKVERLLKL